MAASRLVGRRLARLSRAARLSLFGLPGAIALLILAATIAAGTSSRPAAAARSGYDWVTSWGASPQDPSPGTLGLEGFHDARRRGVRVLVRVQLDEAAVARLLAGRVGGHRANGGTQM